MARQSAVADPANRQIVSSQVQSPVPVFVPSSNLPTKSMPLEQVKTANSLVLILGIALAVYLFVIKGGRGKIKW